MAEVTKGEERTEFALQSSNALRDTSQVVRTELRATDPIRLGLVRLFILFNYFYLIHILFLIFYPNLIQDLSFAVYFYEMLDEKQRAIELAKNAFDDAIVIIH